MGIHVQSDDLKVTLFRGGPIRWWTLVTDVARRAGLEARASSLFADSAPETKYAVRAELIPIGEVFPALPNLFFTLYPEVEHRHEQRWTVDTCRQLLWFLESLDHTVKRNLRGERAEWYEHDIEQLMSGLEYCITSDQPTCWS